LMPKRSSESIMFAQFLYEEDLVSVTFLRQLQPISAGGAQIGPFEEGKEGKIPLWVAKALEADGAVKINWEEGSLKPSELYKLSWKEEKNEGISQLPKHFYPKLRALLSALNEAIKKNPTHTLLNEQRQSIMKAQDLINCRLQKILRLAMERNPSKALTEALEPEERALYSAIRSEIDDWRLKLLSEETKRGE